MKRSCVKFLYQLKQISKKINFIIAKMKFTFLKNNKNGKKLDIDYNKALKIVSSKRQLPVMNKKEFKIQKKEIDLSIIIPVYNSEKYIKECINSIINQKLKYKIEIICVNDGSIDSSLVILNSFKDERIKIYNQVNSGAATARNVGIDMATGRYIMFIDSDDFLPQNSLNNFLEVAYQCDADIVAGNVEKYIEKYDISVCLKKHNNFETNDLLEMCNCTEGAPWGKIYKIELWNKIRFHVGQAFEDCIIFLNVYPKVRKFIYINRSIYCFRSSDNSLYKRSKKDYTCIDSFWGVMSSYLMLTENKNAITFEHLELFIWHLSAIMYERIKNLDSLELKKSIVILSKKLIFEIIQKNKISVQEFNGKNAKYYKKIIDVLKSGNFAEWEQISNIILLSGKI